MRHIFTLWLTNYINHKKKEATVLSHPLNTQNCDVIHSLKFRFRIDNRNFQYTKNIVVCIIYLSSKFYLLDLNGLLLIF
jgi:hypothetical protein